MCTLLIHNTALLPGIQRCASYLQRFREASLRMYREGQGDYRSQQGVKHCQGPVQPVQWHRRRHCILEGPIRVPSGHSRIVAFLRGDEVAFAEVCFCRLHHECKMAPDGEDRALQGQSNLFDHCPRLGNFQAPVPSFDNYLFNQYIRRGRLVGPDLIIVLWQCMPFLSSSSQMGNRGYGC